MINGEKHPVLSPLSEEVLRNSQKNAFKLLKVTRTFGRKVFPKECILRVNGFQKNNRYDRDSVMPKYYAKPVLIGLIDDSLVS